MTASTGDVLDLSILELGTAFREGRCSPVEVATAALARITEAEPAIHAWVLVDHEQSISAARQAAQELRAGVDRGPLHGIPLGVKDIYDVVGWPTRCGSAARRDTPPAGRDADVVAMLRQAGAVLLGKTVTQEFAAGVVSPPARNPWHPSRIPGGSSGGSAAAIAIGACRGALGSDTGGSIRIPAAACGVVGFKPAYGQLSVAGVYPLSESLDTVGPLARSVEDAWIIWQSMLGTEHTEATLRRHATTDLSGVRVGIPEDYFFTWLQPGVRAQVSAAIASLQDLGATVIDASWPEASTARAAAFIINRLETAFVHEQVALNDTQRFQRYGETLRLRVAAGRSIPATLYLQALQARERISHSMAALFTAHDLDALLAPTLPTTALPADDLTIAETGLEESLGAAWTRLTMPFNATGQAVLAMPCGVTDDGLPVGLQLAGTLGNEAMLFRIGQALEFALGTDRHFPPLLRRQEEAEQAKVSQ